MARLCRTLAALEDSLLALERRGIGLRTHAARQDAATSKLPIYHVFLGNHEHWFTKREELDAFVTQQEEAAGTELTVDDAGDKPGAMPAQSMARRPTMQRPMVQRLTAIRSAPAGCTSSSCTKCARLIRCSAIWPKWVSTSNR